MALDRKEYRAQDLWERLPIELLIKVLRDYDLPVSTLAACRSVFFDGKLELIMVGLVVDQTTKHFKLVLGGVLFPDRRRSLIYKSTTSRWSWIIDPFPALLNWMEVECKDGKSVLCNGCMYWLVWDPTTLIMALLIFDLSEERWDVMAEEVMEDTSDGLQITAYEGRVYLLAMDWTHFEFDRRIYGGKFLHHPMVRRMDRSLIGRTRDLWDMEDGRPFKIYAAGGSDVFFVFDTFDVTEEEEEDEYLEVAKYWSERDVIEFLPEPPFREGHEMFVWAFRPEIEPRFFRDAWCAIIPAPRVNAEQKWITQQQRHL
ncbi:hypothetical protein AXG93_2551s1000 [Marchantia polymorpha subsp. ruderalis]|uniref:F-box domain-containing protein n=1 Tax=Marchantia polymorpha subsp. ruderalis TaxID=1480154 RepID=A0A176VEJ4_MARPO|nr:hypothetical protein AXG93_2551s1000 [Marchantia polymorpha subsp. ruderalis]